MSVIGESSPRREDFSRSSGEDNKSLSPPESWRRLSLGNASDDSNSEVKESPIQKELRKMHRAASTMAIALTESHESDEEFDKVTVSDVDEDELTDDDDDRLSMPSAITASHSVASGVRYRIPIGRRGGDQPTRKSSAVFRTDGSSPAHEAPSSTVSSITVESLQVLDELDRSICLPVFRLELGMVFEYIMLFFGTWFGLPVPAWGLWTSTFALVDEFEPLYQLDPVRAKVSLGIVTAGFAFYLFMFTRWISKGKYQSVYGNLKQLAAIPLLYLVVFMYGTTMDGYNSGAYYVTTWVFAETIGHLFKYVLKRYRPIAYLPPSDLGHRHFPDVQHMFSKGHTAMESFPSADTLGGALFACTLEKMELIPLPAAIGLSLVIAFSRIYLQAHHLFDVGVALVLGWASADFMWDKFGRERLLGPPHAVGSVLFFVVFALIARKFKRALPKHMERSKSMYGF